MYFEEKIINGILCWRDTPTGEWQQYSAAEISAKYEQVQLRLAQKNGETPVTIDNNRSDLIAEMEKTATGYIRAGYLGTGTQIREWVRQLSTCG